VTPEIYLSLCHQWHGLSQGELDFLLITEIKFLELLVIYFSCGIRE